MKRLIVCLMLLGCVAMSSGCGTVAKRALGEVITIKTRSLEIGGGSAMWTTYEAFEFGRVTDDVGGQVPADVMAKLIPLATEELQKAGLFKRVGGSGGGKVLLVDGEIIDFDGGGIGRAIGSDKPFLTIRGTFKDKATGKALSVVNLQATCQSLRDWTQIVSKGYGKAIEKYLKSKGLQELPE